MRSACCHLQPYASDRRFQVLREAVLLELCPKWVQPRRGLVDQGVQADARCDVQYLRALVLHALEESETRSCEVRSLSCSS